MPVGIAQEAAFVVQPVANVLRYIGPDMGHAKDDGAIAPRDDEKRAHADTPGRRSPPTASISAPEAIRSPAAAMSPAI